MRVISGSSNQPLAQAIATQLGVDMVAVSLETFKNREKRVRILDSVQGENICLVQSFSNPSDEHIIEFLLLTDALERAGARHVNLVLPWMAYSLQDKVFQDGESIAAKVIANLISNAFVHRVLLLDVHNTSIPGFFSKPTTHLSALNLFAEHCKKVFDLQTSIVVSPDFGGLKRARVFADILDLPLANIDKHRGTNGDITIAGISDEVSGKTCLIFDDVINTGGTVVEVARFLKTKGAVAVHFVVTHGLFADHGMEKVTDPAIDSIIITDSIYHPDLPQKLTSLSSASLFVPHIRKWM